MIPGRLVTPLCEAAGVDDKRVYHIEIAPLRIEFHAYATDDRGRLVIDGDGDIRTNWTSHAIDWSDKC